MTCKPSLEINKKAIQQPFTTIAAVGQELAVRFPDTAISNSTIARHLQNQFITTKIAGNDSDAPYERNRPNTIQRHFQYATWLVNLGQYLHLPVCATSSIPSFTGVHQRQVYIDESRFSIFTRRTKDRAPLGERVRRVVAPRGRNVNITLAISPDMGLVHHAIEQRMVFHQTIFDASSHSSSNSHY